MRQLGRMLKNIAQPAQSLPTVHTVEAVAHAARLHPESVRRAIRRGDVTAIKFGPSWRIADAEATRILTGGLSFHRG